MRDDNGNGSGNGKGKRGPARIYPPVVKKKTGPKGPHYKSIVRQQVISDCKALVESSAMNLTKAIMEEEARLAFSDIRGIFDEEGNILPPHLLPEDIARAIRTVKVIERTIPQGQGQPPLTVVSYEYMFWDKGTALERMSRHLGLYRADNEQKPKAVNFKTINVNMAKFSDEELKMLLRLGGKLEGDNLKLPQAIDIEPSPKEPNSEGG